VKKKLPVKLSGDRDESGRTTRRLTLSPAESAEPEGERAPEIGIDTGARLSEEQADEDAIESAPIPPEYREIIKRIHSTTFGYNLIFVTKTLQFGYKKGYASEKIIDIIPLETLHWEKSNIHSGRRHARVHGAF